jgi:hypothetical protein
MLKIKYKGKRNISELKHNLRACIRRIWARPSLSGRENSTRRSIRPGRNSAGSRVSGLKKKKLQKTKIKDVVY